MSYPAIIEPSDHSGMEVVQGYNQSDTTLATWAFSILSALKAHGFDHQILVDRCHIDMTLEHNADARVPITLTRDMMAMAIQITGDPSFGLQVARQTRPTSWHGLGYGIYASNTIRDCFDRIQKYSRIFSTSGYTHYREEGDCFVVELQIHSACSDIISASQIEAILATFVLTYRHLCHDRFPLQKVTIPSSKPNNIQNYERMFKCPIEFDAPVTSLYVPIESVDYRLASANQTLAKESDNICEQYLAQMDQPDLITQISQYIVKNLHKGDPSIQEVSQALNYSARSLQRKLTSQNTSFKEVIENLKLRLAIQYISQSNLPISEISFRLGFSHTSNFSRAFKRWTGKGPTEYRMKY